MSGKGRGSVVGEMVGLVPLVGRIVRRRVGEWVEESRESLRETVREVRGELERELGDHPEEEIADDDLGVGPSPTGSQNEGVDNVKPEEDDRAVSDSGEKKDPQ